MYSFIVLAIVVGTLVYALANSFCLIAGILWSACNGKSTPITISVSAKENSPMPALDQAPTIIHGILNRLSHLFFIMFERHCPLMYLNTQE